HVRFGACRVLPRRVWSHKRRAASRGSWRVKTAELYRARLCAIRQNTEPRGAIECAAMGMLFLVTVACGFCFGMGALVGYFHGLRHARRENQPGFPVVPLESSPGDPSEETTAASNGSRALPR